MSGKRPPSTGSAYTKTTIPQLPQPHHDTVVELLTSALRPIGEHRTTAPKPSKKHGQKRKRKPPSEKSETGGGQENQDAPHVRPRIQDSVLIGFNSVTRHLESLSAASASKAGVSFERENNEKSGAKLPRHVAAVFLLRPLDELIYAHLPTLSYTASFAHPDASPTRMVLLDPAAEKLLTASLAQVRVSVLAVLEDEGEDTGTKQLVDYIREHVEAVEVPWLKEAVEAKWLGTKVELQ